MTSRHTPTQVHQEGVDEARAEGGRGLYWDDPDGNALEILTVPDGGWPTGHPRRP
jgi:hypothetical protein